MNKFVQRWLLCTCFLAVLPYISTEPQKRCTLVQSTIDKTEYWCIHNTTEIIFEINYNKIIKIICSRYENLGTEYLNFIKGIVTPPTVDRFHIKQCPVPDVSFSKIFDLLNVHSVKELVFESLQNNSDGFKPYHFENLSSIEILNLRNNYITELPEPIFKGVPNLKKLFLDTNAIGVLPSKILKPTTKLTKLILGSNRLTSLDSEVFRYTPDLQYLNVYTNNLQNIPENIFKRLYQLTSLDFSSNNISRLDDGVFKDLQRMEVLSLNYNNLIHIPPSLFANNRKLLNIKMMKACSDNTSTLPSGLFANLSSLYEIYLNANKFISLPEDLFQNCANLSILWLRDNSLTTLPPSIFRDTSNLTDLDLSFNKLESLNNNLFHSLKKLTRLKLNGNRLAYLNNYMFATLQSLTELDLSRNNLMEIEVNTFVELQNLVTIDLSSNNLTFKRFIQPEHSSSPLRMCKKLETLNLKNNSLTEVFDDWRFVLVDLKKLDLSFNKFTILTTADLIFTYTKNVVSVDLSNNQINSVRIDDLESYLKIECASPPCSDNSPGNREEIVITLKNNPIRCDCGAFYLAKYFRNEMSPVVYHRVKLISTQVHCHWPESLANVSLSNVDLYKLRCPLNQVYFPKNMTCPTSCICEYRPVDKCIVVNCSGIGLTSFPKDLPTLYDINVELLFANNSLESLDGLSDLLSMTNVTKLSLSHNNFKNVDDLEIPNVMKTLELDNNQLSNLSKKVMQQLNSSTTLTTVTLHNNPWQCNCETKHLSNFLRSQIKYKQIPNIHNITCKENGHSVVNLSVDDLCRVSLTIIITCVSLAIFGMLGGAAIALYYIYENEIKIWLYAHKLFLWLITEKEIDKDKQFDAFVSFSSKDADFVVDHLIPELEQKGEHRFKLCVHTRDFQVGAWIPNQIVYCVENSRRTIIILSPNFLKSEWAWMEFRTAHLKTIKERCARVIVILLADVDIEKLDPELKSYITTNTYIKWGDSKFWDRLRFALPHPQDYFKQRKANVVPLTKSELKKKQALFKLKDIYTAKI